MGFFDKFKQGLKKTSQLLNTDIRDLFRSEGRLVDEDFLDEWFAIPGQDRHGRSGGSADRRRNSRGVPRPRRQDVRDRRSGEGQAEGTDAAAGRADPVCRERSHRDHGLRRQRLWQDHLDRQAGTDVHGRRQEGRARGGRHLPCGGRRAVDHLVAATRLRDRHRRTQ